MTKQELGEWLAEKVLGWTRVNFVTEGYRGKNWRWKVPNSLRSYPEVKSGNIQTIYEFIDSPDGMDSVWDAVVEKGYVYLSLCKTLTNVWACTLAKQYHEGNTPVLGNGKTRREAFYNAVYEAMK